MNNNLKQVRKDRGMSVSELSRRSGLSRTAIIKLEKGESNPLATTMFAISLALGMEVCEIFFNPSVIRE